MANVLKDAQRLIGSESKTLVGQVIASAEGKSKVRIGMESSLNVWGTARRGSWVMIRDDQILGETSSDDADVVFVV